MFENIGGKIKGLAMILCWIGIIGSIIGGICMFVAAGNAYYSSELALYTTLGFVIMIAGSLLSWLGSFILYGFGELIERTASINEKLASQSFYLYNLSESFSTMMRSSSLPIENTKQNSTQTQNEGNQPSENNVKSNTTSNESTHTHTANSFSISELQTLKKMHEEGNLSEEEYQACLAYKDE